MGCGGERERGPPEQKQRWEFITLSDFKRTSIWTPLAYGWLWFMAFVGVAVYAVDTFTAVNLLAFDKWSSQVQPFISFDISKWIFSGCIFFSWALLIYEGARAWRVMKKGGVAASYMDPIAGSLQCMRSSGWRRFLVFNELTKSKKGTDYIAFFVYFAFKGAVRIILAEGPRQVVNALTLYAVMNAKLIGGKEGDSRSGIQIFWANLEALADENTQQAVILMSMLFTLVIWVFSALCLLAASILYIVFLWHYIPQQDGRLRTYCRRKIDRRLEKIVAHKVQAAIEDENRKKEKAEKKAELKRQKTGELPPPQAPQLARQPTLPMLGESPELKQEDKLPKMPLSRMDTTSTVSTLPVYSSRPSTSHTMRSQPSLPDLGPDDERPAMPSRMPTRGSNWSKTSSEMDAPLLSHAGYAGGSVDMPAPSYSRQTSHASSFNRPMPGRMNTQSTQASQRSFTPVSRMDTLASQRSFTPTSNYGRPPPNGRFPVRSNTGFSYEEPRSAVRESSPIDAYGASSGPPPIHNGSNPYRPPPQRLDSNVSYFSRPTGGPPPPSIDRQPTYGSAHSQQAPSSRSESVPPRRPSHAAGGSFSRPFIPASTQSYNSYEMTSQPPQNSGFVAFNHGVQNAPTLPSPQDGPRRNITVTGTGAPSNDFPRHVPQRSFTAPIEDNRAISSYGSILDEYGAQPSSGYPSQQGGWQGRY